MNSYALVLRDIMDEKGIALIFGVGTISVIVALFVAFSVPSENLITGKAISFGQAPLGYASPHDPYNGNEQITDLSVNPSGNQFFGVVNVHSNNPGGYVYETGYYLSGGEWHQFNFSGANGGWVSNSASYSISDAYANHVLTSGDEEFVVAVYSCKDYNGWKCGCAAQDDCGYWMLQSVDLGSGFTNGAYLEVTPTRTDVNQGSQFNVDVELIGGNSIYGYDIDIEYDESVLSFVTLSYQGYLGVDGYPPNSVDPDFLCVDHSLEAGAVRNIACTRIGTDLSNGDGTLLRLTFQGTTEGYSQVRIAASEIAEWPDVASQGSTPVISTWDVNNAYVVVS